MILQVSPPSTKTRKQLSTPWILLYMNHPVSVSGSDYPMNFTVCTELSVFNIYILGETIPQIGCRPTHSSKMELS